MSESKLGIQETKDVLDALNLVSLELVKVFKNGIQYTDAVQLFAAISGSEALKASLHAAYINVSAVPAELKDLDASEGVELGMTQLSFVPKIIESLKK